MKALLTAAWAALLFVTSLPASAQPEWEAQSVKVNYSDLDLAKAQGVSTLQHRVSSAVRQVCDRSAFDLGAKLQEQACARTAATTAQRDVNKAIATARQLPNAKALSSQTMTTRLQGSIVSSKQQPLLERRSISRR